VCGGMCGGGTKCRTVVRNCPALHVLGDRGSVTTRKAQCDVTFKATSEEVFAVKRPFRRPVDVSQRADSSKPAISGAQLLTVILLQT
jgi:hypothetical protein